MSNQEHHNPRAMDRNFIYTADGKAKLKTADEIMAILSFLSCGAENYFHQDIKWSGHPYRFKWAGKDCSIEYKPQGEVRK